MGEEKGMVVDVERERPVRRLRKALERKSRWAEEVFALGRCRASGQQAAVIVDDLEERQARGDRETSDAVKRRIARAGRSAGPASGAPACVAALAEVPAGSGLSRRAKRLRLPCSTVILSRMFPTSSVLARLAALLPPDRFLCDPAQLAAYESDGLTAFPHYAARGGGAGDAG